MERRWSDTDGTSWLEWDVSLMGVVKANSNEGIIQGRVRSYSW